MADEVTLSVTPTSKDNEMAFPEYTELGNLQGAMSAMTQSFSAAAARRVDRFDQLGADASSMWSIHMTTPTVMAAHGMRVASEAGAGRTRIESNTPAGTQVVGPQQ
jgi:Tfp pilus assembly protein FimT